MPTTLEALAHAVADLTAQVAEIKEQSAEIISFVAGGLKNGGRGMQQDIQTMITQMNLMQTMFTQMVARHDTMDGQLSRHSGDLRVLESKADGLEGRVTKLEATYQDVLDTITGDFKEKRKASRAIVAKAAPQLMKAALQGLSAGGGAALGYIMWHMTH